jgi:hypothetical protein
LELGRLNLWGFRDVLAEFRLGADLDRELLINFSTRSTGEHPAILSIFQEDHRLASVGIGVLGVGTFRKLHIIFPRSFSLHLIALPINPKPLPHALRDCPGFLN